ncbi:MAG: 6,7-dimethyl-8-ribityllumazine synthase [candidate division WOR-3 bacterium]|uniref:6,7-dimethyl-8-ribityllumazine synthase n=1 Tax=candidate division WOR-3 bacterium TaxID=2052148 RepID=A0A7V4ABP0_UNCW3
MKEFKGKLRADKYKIGIVISRFNEFITKRLLEGAIEALKRYGAKEENIDVYWVPGSFEIPYILKEIVSKDYDGFLAIGCIIKGDTPHFEYIANETIKGIQKIMYEYKKPIGLGILTVEDMEQAIERAGGKMGNKGEEAAKSLVELLNLKEIL